MANINYRSFDDMALAIRKNMYKIKEQIDLVVGIPRSGMIPAYMIALFKNIKACSLDEFLNQSKISNGMTRSTKEIKEIKNVLVVDDSIHSGASMIDTKNKISATGLDKKYNIKYLAVFAKDKSAVSTVDYFLEIVATPRMFQWNYLNININERSCFDIDGVLCVDPTPEQNDDGKEYHKFLLNATPLYIPKYKIHSLVTSRLEKYRKETETWLKKNHVEYQNLYMLNLKTKEERIKQNAHAKFKAKIYLENEDTEMFVESSAKQAEEISRLTGKPCMCVENDRLYRYYGTPEMDLIDLHEYDNITNKKKVLLYSHEFTYTGAPHSLLRICRVILNKGYYVEVWGPVRDSFVSEFEKLGVKVRIIPASYLDNKSVKKAVEKFDLAIVNTIIPHRAYEVFKEIIPTIWYVREATNIPDICKNTPDRVNALKNAKNVYTVSEYAADYIRKNYNKSVQVIHNCVEDFAPQNNVNIVKDKLNFVALGTISRRKAFDIYIDAFEKLPKEYQKKAHLYFAGRLVPGWNAQYEPILERAKKNPNITYAGEITDIQEKVDFLSKMNVVVVVSRDESCSLVALEGAMMSKPLIVSQNVGAKYMIDNKNGYIVPTGDSDALSKVYKEMIDNVDKINEMSVAARKSYEEKATIDLYTKNIGEMIDKNLKVSANSYRKQIARAKKIDKNLIVKGIRSLKKNGFRVTLNKVMMKLHLRKRPTEVKSIFSWGRISQSSALSNVYLCNHSGKINAISVLTTNCLPVKDANMLDESKSSNRMINIDCNKTYFEEMKKSNSNYFIMDLLDEKYLTTKVAIKHKDYIITKSPSLDNELKNINQDAEIKSFQFSEEKEKIIIKNFCEKLKEIYKTKNIILIKANYPLTYVAQNGKNQSFDERTIKIAKNNNERINRLFSLVKKNLKNCKIIDMTKNCIVKQSIDKDTSVTDFDKKCDEILTTKINNLLYR